MLYQIEKTHLLKKEIQDKIMIKVMREKKIFKKTNKKKFYECFKKK